MNNGSFHQCTTRCQVRAAQALESRRVVADFRSVNQNLAQPPERPQFRREEAIAAGQYTIRNLSQTYDHVSLDTQRTIAAIEDAVPTNVTQQSQNSSSLGWSDSVRKEFQDGYRTCPDYAERFKHPEEPFVKKDGLRFHKSHTMMCVCDSHSGQPPSDFHHRMLS